MKRLNLLNALVSAFVLLILAAFIMGLQLSLDGTKLVVNGAGEVRWTWIAIGCAIVFVFQLFRPMVSSGLKKISGPGWVLPSFDGSTPKQKLLALVLIIAAIATVFLGRAVNGWVRWLRLANIPPAITGGILVSARR